MRRGFVSGKVTAPNEQGYSEVSLSVIDLNSDRSYQYHERVLSGRAFYPHSLRSFTMDIAFKSILSQYRHENGV